jgi:tetratricopeptide (TPR) repeat protein
MKKIFALLSFVLLFTVVSYACINGETITLKDGTVISEDHPGGIIPHGHMLFPHNYQKKLTELDSLWKRTNDIDYLSDYGIVLILLKKYEEAREVFTGIEKIKPGRYATASNLGTLYELMGDNENALRWIKRSVEIDPASHKSSEWLHVNILEAKIRGEQFITSDFLLNNNFGSQPKPESTLSREELLKLRDALYYQLNERVSFIKPKDRIVAELLFQLGNVSVLTNARKEAVSIYNQAIAYGYNDPLVEARLKYLGEKTVAVKDTLVKENKVLVKGEKRSNFLVWTIAGVFVMVAIFMITRRRKKIL